jgi:AraC-like DNA-binding protein
VTVSTRRPAPVGEDSRGILHPAALQRLVRLTRFPAGPELAGLIDRFWAVEWDLPPGTTHTQQVLTHPCGNLSVGHADARAGTAGRVEARLNGVARKLTTRQLAGRGWTVAAMTTPGGLGAFIHRPASAFADRVVPLGPPLGLDEAGLVEEVHAQPDMQARAGVLERALHGVLAAADPQRITRARQVAEVAHIAETDRSVRQLRHLCAQTGLGARTLQRMFLQHAGVPPTWVLRRYRLLDAAEAVREGQPVDWAAVAADLGYADQAHLIRDFRAATGQTPAAYAQSQRAAAVSGAGSGPAGDTPGGRR